MSVLRPLTVPSPYDGDSLASVMITLSRDRYQIPFFFAMAHFSIFYTSSMPPFRELPYYSVVSHSFFLFVFQSTSHYFYFFEHKGGNKREGPGDATGGEVGRLPLVMASGTFWSETSSLVTLAWAISPFLLSFVALAAPEATAAGLCRGLSSDNHRQRKQRWQITRM